MRDKTVILDIKIRIIKIVPESWGKDMINFHENKSSYCLDNIIDDIKKSSKVSCLCNFAKVKYIREATQLDEDVHEIFIKNSRS